MNWIIYVVNAVVISFVGLLADKTSVFGLAISILIPATFVITAVGYVRGKKWASISAIILTCISLFYWTLMGLLLGGIAAFARGGMEGSRSKEPFDTTYPLIGAAVMMLIALAPTVIQIRGILRSRHATSDQQTGTL